LVTKSSNRSGKSFAFVDKSVAVYASSRRGKVVPDSNELSETFLSSGGSLYDEGICLARLRVGFEFPWLGGFFGRARGGSGVRRETIL
jgi:hypothetical protein